MCALSHATKYPRSILAQKNAHVGAWDLYPDCSCMSSRWGNQGKTYSGTRGTFPYTLTKLLVQLVLCTLIVKFLAGLSMVAKQHLCTLGNMDVPWLQRYHYVCTWDCGLSLKWYSQINCTMSFLRCMGLVATWSTVACLLSGFPLKKTCNCTLGSYKSHTQWHTLKARGTTITWQKFCLWKWSTWTS